MLSLLTPHRVPGPHRVLRIAVADQRGFTLIEVLVAMVTGVIVTGALFTILDFSVKQSSRLSGVAQATQVGRGAMTRIVEELHSSCLASGFTPVMEKSSPTKLILVNGYNEKEPEKVKGEEPKEPPAELLASGIHKDVIEYEKATGRLIDTTYRASNNTPLSTAEKFAWEATPTSKVRLAEHVTQMEEGGKTLPVFKYYAYTTTPATLTSAPATTLNEETLTKTEASTLTEAEAKNVAGVVVSFRTAPYSKEARISSASEKATFADLSTQTTFAFSAPNSETAISAAPCE